MLDKTEEQIKMKIYGRPIGKNLYSNLYIYLHYISRNIFIYLATILQEELETLTKTKI